jgi:hypothetical protein
MFTTVRVGKYSRPSAFAIVQWIGFIFVWFVFFVVNGVLCMVDRMSVSLARSQKNEPEIILIEAYACFIFFRNLIGY